MYLHWLRSGDKVVWFKLLALADACPENERARQLAGAASPYFGYLPDPCDATTNLIKQMIEKDGKMVKLTRHSLTSLEAPSNFLIMPALFEAELNVLAVQKPDPRLPRKAVDYLLWTYEGLKPKVAVPPPAADVAEKIAELAGQKYHLPAWLRHACRIGQQFGPGRVRDVLATMVHPPMMDQAQCPWAWLYRIQIAAALVISQLESAWDNSIRKKALYSLAWGPMDWTVDASLVALAAIAAEEENTADDIAALFREMFANLPTGGPSCYYRAAVVDVALTEPGGGGACRPAQASARLVRSGHG